jgi:hypothetical protein
VATLLRIVRTEDPKPADFMPSWGRGLPPRDDPDEALLLWLGLSTWATARQAAKKARAWPTLGEYLAELKVPEHPAIVVRRTLSSAGHYSLWGDPRRIARYVERTFSVQSALEGLG